VAAVPGLRPTPDRVRETLFNWLQPVLPGARCLDLYAGTGVLGLEAASRGAQSVHLVERNPVALTALRNSVSMLDADRVQIVAEDVLSWLRSAASPFDVVFVDPPYGQALAEATCVALASDWLAPGARIYLETESEAGDASLPKQWQLLHETSGGQVRARLFRV
jgi:16S rRNA (guanine966-N2)-methyltransferase